MFNKGIVTCTGWNCTPPWPTSHCISRVRSSASVSGLFISWIHEDGRSINIWNSGYSGRHLNVGAKEKMFRGCLWRIGRTKMDVDWKWYTMVGHALHGEIDWSCGSSIAGENEWLSEEDLSNIFGTLWDNLLWFLKTYARTTGYGTVGGLLWSSIETRVGYKGFLVR